MYAILLFGKSTCDINSSVLIIVVFYLLVFSINFFSFN